MSRRQVAGVAAAAALMATFGAAAPAKAFLGLGGDGKAAAEEYTRETVSESCCCCYR